MFALLYGRQLPTQVLLVLWAHQFTKTQLIPAHNPSVQSGRFLQEHQGSTCMGVNEERWGRHSPGHNFQEDCTYECAVPSDCSLAVSAAHKWLQLSFFTQESAFL